MTEQQVKTGVSQKAMLASGLKKRTYDVTKKQIRGLESLRDSTGTPTSVSVRFALEAYLEEKLGVNYV